MVRDWGWINGLFVNSKDHPSNLTQQAVWNKSQFWSINIQICRCSNWSYTSSPYLSALLLRCFLGEDVFSHHSAVDTQAPYTSPGNSCRGVHTFALCQTYYVLWVWLPISRFHSQSLVYTPVFLQAGNCRVYKTWYVIVASRMKFPTKTNSLPKKYETLWDHPFLWLQFVQPQTC